MGAAGVPHADEGTNELGEDAILLGKKENSERVSETFLQT